MIDAPPEPWFYIEYSCPRCGAVWADEWDSVVDDDCPACGLRHVVASSFTFDLSGQESPDR